MPARRRSAFALIGVAVGAAVGFVLAVIASWATNSEGVSPVTVFVSAIAFALVGWLRGPAVGDITGMWVHALYQVWVPWWGDENAPRGTYQPITLTGLLIALALIAFWAA